MHILLIHGALGAGAQLEPLRDHLRDLGTIHLLELDGHGATSPRRSAFTIEGFADDVRAELDRREIERAMIFGYSMGGYVALKVAADAGERVHAVATLGTKLAWSPDIARRETGRLDPATISAKVPKFATILEERHARAGGWEHVLEKTAAMMRALGDNPTLDDVTIARITSPACVMVGDRDTVVTAEETVSTGRALSRGEVVILPNTAHPFEQVRVPLLASVLRDFFARASAS